MNADAGLKNGRDLARFVRPPSPRAGNRRLRNERGSRVLVTWGAIGAAAFAIVAWLIASTLLRWVTLD